MEDRSVWKAEEIERMAKALGGRQVVEKWEANVIEFLEMLLSNPSIMLASCLLPLVFSFKLMFRKVWAEFGTALDYSIVLFGTGPCSDISTEPLLDGARISN